MKNSMPRKLSLFRKSLIVACAGIISSSAFALSPLPYPLWTVEGGKLLDPNGNPFVFRGVTIDHSRAPEKTLQALKDIAALGANSAQIEFAIKPSGDTPFPRPVANELREIIKTCKDNKLVCVLEANDAAGYFEVEGGLGPDVVAEYWGYYDIREVLNGAQGHIVIGISNQPLAPIFDAEDYIDRMRYSISIIKNAYPLFTVMVDGSNWGQDTNKAMHTLAAQNLQSTSVYQDVIYSVEMFDHYLNPEKVRDYIAIFSEIGAPLVVGGFGPAPYYHPHAPIPTQADAPRLPAESVMQYAEQYGAGYFGWSWSGNKNSALDIVVDWNPVHLTSWGNILFNDVNGIKTTAKQASIFSSSSSSSTTSSSVSSNNNPVAVIDNTAIEFIRCGVVYGKASALRSTDPDGDALTYKWIVRGRETYTFTEPEIRFSMFWPYLDYMVSLEVNDGKGGVSTSSTAMKHSYSNACPPPQSSSSTSVSRSSSSVRSSSSFPSSNGSSISKSVSSSSRSSSSMPAKSNCNYVINSQWNNGFTAVIRIKNTSTQPISGWDVNWQYADGSKITNLWNANLNGSNPYSAKNLSWNTTIQPGQTVEFGLQGTKTGAVASVPVVTGGVCH